MKLAYFIRASLLILMISSLGLTWAIWTLPNKVENRNNLNGNKTETNTTLRENDVFSPFQLVYHDEAVAKSTTNADLLNRVEKELDSWRFTNIQDYRVLGDSYSAKLNEANTLELVYPVARPFMTITNSFQKLASNYKNQKFQRILIPLNDSKEVYFFNDTTATMYSSEIEGFNKKDLLDMLDSSERPLVEVNLQKLAERYVYLPKEAVGLSKLTYISELKPSIDIRNRLFDDLSEITSSTSQDKNFEQYYDNVSKVSINKETHILTYNRSSTSVKMNMQDVLKYSLSELQDFDIWPGRTRFFQYDEGKQQVIYRRYIEGLPIFGDGNLEHDFGATYLTITKDGTLSRLQIPLNVAQTPIYSKMTEKKLASGSELLAYLVTLGYQANEIEDIQLGYAWTTASDSGAIENGANADKIVEFVPSWYMLIKGNWYNVAELSAKDEEGNRDNGL
ncbi:YycH family regulatory protein [Carnobacterium gallinarum]|uniref:YycH family regulatory protein n=1 Tax=Carnobacterium gallinarum TaxID=2749 RepID=UPI00055644BA|nr:two-component system activity regulator YycH [Carnobacterium gallinarum]